MACWLSQIARSLSATVQLVPFAICWMFPDCHHSFLCQGSPNALDFQRYLRKIWLFIGQPTTYLVVSRTSYYLEQYVILQFHRKLWISRDNVECWKEWTRYELSVTGSRNQCRKFLSSPFITLHYEAEKRTLGLSDMNYVERWRYWKTCYLALRSSIYNELAGVWECLHNLNG